MTTRGMKETEARTIARLIAEVIDKREACFDSVNKQVAALCKAFPLYDNIVK